MKVADKAWIWSCCGCRPAATADSTPNLGNSICCRYGPKKTKKKKKKNVNHKIKLFRLYVKPGKRNWFRIYHTKSNKRSSCCGSVVKNPTSIQEDSSLILDLTQWVQDLALLQAAAYIGCRCGSDLELLSYSVGWQL